MKIEEGPAFGALIIGLGVAYLLYRQTGNALLALAVGIGIAIADYYLVLFFRSFGKK